MEEKKFCFRLSGGLSFINFRPLFSDHKQKHQRALTKENKTKSNFVRKGQYECYKKESSSTQKLKREIMAKRKSRKHRNNKSNKMWRNERTNNRDTQKWQQKNNIGILMVEGLTHLVRIARILH